MKKNYVYKFCLFVSILLAFGTANAQCIWSQLTANAHSNTAHTITVNNPVGGNLQPLFPPLGTYNLTLNYLDDFNNPVTQTSTAAIVNISNSGQFVITDNSITFPTIANNNYDFPGTSGSAQLSGPGGFYTWTWTNDQLLNCAPLPVTLISFNISTFNVPAGYSKLIWEIVEYDNSHYIIERSTNGGLSFTDYGIEPAVGSYGSQLTYNFVVPNPNAGTSFLYRLRMIDPNGSFTYSPILFKKGAGTGNPTNFCSFTNIEGAASACSNTNVFKMHNAAPGINWSTNFGTFNVTNGGAIATLTGCTSTNTTVSASSAGCVKTKTITACTAGSITGPNTLCTTANYTLSNPVGSSIIWSTNPAGIADINCVNCNPVTLTKVENGQITLTASITSCSGSPVTASKIITVGNTYAPLTGTYSTNGGGTKPLYTVNSVPVGNVYTQFQWSGVTNISSALAVGAPSGTGFYSYGNMFSFNIATSQAVTVNITGTSTCGQVIATRTFVQSNYSYAVSVSPNPANATINVAITKVFNPSSGTASSLQQLELSKSNTDITKMYLYDFYTNNMVKQWTYNEKESTSYNLNIAGVKSGVYLLKMERDSKTTVTKIIIQQ
jgi:Secretion system C-terminal sorting domain